MGLVVLAVAAELVLFGSVAALCVRSRSARKRELARYERAAADARRLAHRALILDASIAELSELVIEECLRDMGMAWVEEEPVGEDWLPDDWSTEPI
ncbi:MAG TPA: hypothetical protein VE991_08165 [Acidimicrobiales bacterium]|nr:hypothetical protein [Acidimicrobiales bacterium]